MDARPDETAEQDFALAIARHDEGRFDEWERLLRRAAGYGLPIAAAYVSAIDRLRRVRSALLVAGTLLIAFGGFGGALSPLLQAATGWPWFGWLPAVSLPTVILGVFLVAARVARTGAGTPEPWRIPGALDAAGAFENQNRQ